MSAPTSNRVSASWLFRMAWRDSRRSRGKLILFSSSVILGIAAMVAIGVFGRNLESAIEEQSKGLLGADLLFESRQPFTESQSKFIDGLSEDQSDQTLFSSMVFFPKSQDTRLAQVRAISGAFPYYGEIETQPADGWDRFLQGEGVVVESSLMNTFNAQVGDSIKVGESTFPIVGALEKIPGDNVFFSAVAPRVYLRLDRLEETGLMGASSLARYRRYVRMESDEAVSQAVAELEERREDLGLHYDTVEERKQELGNAMGNLYRFLNLVGFIALLLGSIGIAGALQSHIQQRLNSVAVLRCLGAGTFDTFSIFLIQGAALGLIGAVGGVVVGLLIVQLLPLVFDQLLPFNVTFRIFWTPTVIGGAVGFVIAFLFSLMPLLQVRRVSPLAVLRTVGTVSSRFDPWLLVLRGFIGLAILGFAIFQSERWQHGVGFAVGLAAALGLLTLNAKLITWIFRFLAKLKWPFVFRYGFSSLFRPGNRTVLLMVSLGLGTFLILTLYLVQHSLVNDLLPEQDGTQPNTILYDIQPDQIDGVRSVMRGQNLPIIDASPVVTMRIESIKGTSVSELSDRPGKDRIPGWTLRREYRSTYRSELGNAEELVAGEWIAHASFDDEVVPISMEEGIAKDLHVTLGDEIIFDIQGIPLTTRIASLRKVEWRRVQANFFVVFPEGVLEDAPGFFIVTTRTPDAASSGRLQRAIVQQFSNVSAVDLSLILGAVEEIISKISVAIRFIALFTVFTGIVLLITAVLNSRFQRIQETILLRTLGAVSSQLAQIQLIEFVVLGLMASLAGVTLAVGAQGLLTHFVFKTSFSVPLPHLLIAIAINIAITVAIGTLTGRKILRQPPLEVLRQAS